MEQLFLTIGQKEVQELETLLKLSLQSAKENRTSNSSTMSTFRLKRKSPLFAKKSMVVMVSSLAN